MEFVLMADLILLSGKMLSNRFIYIYIFGASVNVLLPLLERSKFHFPPLSCCLASTFITCGIGARRFRSKSIEIDSSSADTYYTPNLLEEPEATQRFTHKLSLNKKIVFLFCICHFCWTSFFYPRQIDTSLLSSLVHL